MVNVGEILKRKVENEEMNVGYKKVDIFDVINKNMEIEKIDFGENKYGKFVVIYFTTKEAIKTWSSVLYSQCKEIDEYLKSNKGETVKVRIVKPKGKAYYTFADWK